MKANYPIWYQLLFLVMITGTLASMALNDYGMKLMGIGCIGFTLVFLHELVFHRNRKPIRQAELVVLALLTALLACRSFFIEIPLGQSISAGLFALLTLLYAYFGIKDIRRLWVAQRKAALGLIAYYGALISFLVGFLSSLAGISPDYGTVAGLLFMALFALGHFLFRPLYMDSDAATLLQVAARRKNKSPVILTALLVAGFFYSLIEYRVLPPLYAGDMPVGYTRLIQRAESGKDPHADQGKPKYREYWKAYQKFLERRQ